MDDDFSALDPNPAASALKRQVADIIMWNERSSPRSQQRTIGPSEIGTTCDRRLAYRIAGTARTNSWADPWPAIVGTAVHGWLEQAVERHQKQFGDIGWMTELSVQPDPLVRGRSDLYIAPTCTVVDWKTTGTDTMKKLRRGEPPSPGYVTQINMYGYGHELAGRPVKNVALVYFPRSGWLDDAFVWHAPYDKVIAQAALSRLYRIGDLLLDLDIKNNPERFADIPADPGDNCVWCPLFNRDLEHEKTASDHGCPGR